MRCTSSPSSPFGSRTGGQLAGQQGQGRSSGGCPRQERARKRHRGGGGLAVPGPFKRIARAGGQKVTIRIAQRSVFANSSEAPNYFFATAVTIRLRAMLAEIQANQRCSGQVFARGSNEA